MQIFPFFPYEFLRFSVLFVFQRLFTRSCINDLEYFVLLYILIVWCIVVVLLLFIHENNFFVIILVFVASQCYLLYIHFFLIFVYSGTLKKGNQNVSKAVAFSEGFGKRSNIEDVIN